MMKCAHDLAEMEASVWADALCPLCLQAENERLRAALQEIADHYDGERGVDNYQSMVATKALAVLD